MTIEGIARHHFEAKPHRGPAAMLIVLKFCARIRTLTQLNKS